jgi:transglutaminase-like putative cysteine protease
MKVILKRTIMLLLLSGLATVNAQPVGQMQQLFPDQFAVFSNINRSVEIALKKGVPFAEAREESDMLILNDNARDLYSKGFVYHNSFNVLKNVEAYTLVPGNNGVSKIKVTEFKTQSSQNREIFYDDSKETTFNYPQVMKGSISHVETVHYNKDIRFLSSFYFSNHLPVQNATYSITYPENVDVRYLIRNDEKKVISVKESRKGNKKKLEFTATGIKNYEHFGDGTSIAYYAMHVIVYVASYQTEGKTIPVFSSLDELYKWNSGFLKNINQETDDNLKRITDSICYDKKTDLAKAQAIYSWVQHNVKYVAFEDGLEGFVPRQAADVCTKRYGDCKDMASILTAMLRISGLKACFAWVGTRSIPYRYSEVPLPVTDNHMICALKVDESWIFLDATDPNCIFGMPTSGIQNKEALISISPEKYELVNVPVMPAVKSHVYDNTYLTINNNTLQGKSSVNYSGYFGIDVYNKLLYNKGDDEKMYARSRMAKGSNKFIMLDYNIRLSDPVNKSAIISSGFEIPGYAKSIADEIYINLNLEKLVRSSPVDTSKRKIEIENEFLYSISQVHTLKIPEGYVSQYIPKNTSVSNDVLDFSIVYNQGNNEISSTQKLVMKKLYIQPQDFVTLNNAISVISPAYKEQVVLKKK